MKDFPVIPQDMREDARKTDRTDRKALHVALTGVCNTMILTRLQLCTQDARTSQRF